MEKNDAHDAANGGSEEQSLLDAISAQYAILDSAIKLINQQAKNTSNESKSETETIGWVYNMKGLEEWIHHYTERRKLHCPVCKEDREFVCTECLTQYKYHDEL